MRERHQIATLCAFAVAACAADRAAENASDDGGTTAASSDGGATTDASIAPEAALDATTDAAHDGAGDAGIDARPMIAPPTGTPRTLASGYVYPLGLAVANGYVYFTASEDALVARVPADGGAVEILATNLEDAHGIALDDAGTVFVTMDNAFGAVARIDTDGGVTTLADGELHPVALAVRSEGAYFTTSTSVKRVPLGSGPPIALADQLGGPTGLAVSGGIATFTLYNAGAVARTDGSTTATLVTGVSFPAALAQAESNLYYTCIGDGTIRTVLTDGGGGAILSSGWQNPLAIVSDGAHLYFTTTDGNVVRIDADGGHPKYMAVGEQGPRALAFDDSTLYWTTDPGNEIRALTPR